MDDIKRQVNELVVLALNDPNSITEQQADFLRARAAYVRGRHQDRLPTIFGDKAIKDAQKRIAKKQKEDAKAAANVEKNPETTTHIHPADK